MSDEPRPPSDVSTAVALPTPLDPSWDEAAAGLLAPCAPDGTAAGAMKLLRDARNDPKGGVYGIIVDDRPAAVYLLRKEGMATAIAGIAVAPERRGQGWGRACLQDALRRSGRRPLVAEAGEDEVGFYRACGFKLVGRRRGPEGAPRYRLGAHAPTPRATGPASGRATEGRG